MEDEQIDDLESEGEYVDSVADPADLEEHARSSDRANPRTPTESNLIRGGAVSDEFGPTPDAGSMGPRSRAHDPEQPGPSNAREREITPIEDRFRQRSTLTS